MMGLTTFFTIRFLFVVVLSRLLNCKALCGPTPPWECYPPFPMPGPAPTTLQPCSYSHSVLGSRSTSAMCTAISFLAMHTLLMPTEDTVSCENVNKIFHRGLSWVLSVIIFLKRLGKYSITLFFSCTACNKQMPAEWVKKWIKGHIAASLVYVSNNVFLKFCNSCKVYNLNS